MLALTWPWLFILLPLPLLVFWLLPAASNQESSALKVPFFSLLQTISQQQVKTTHFKTRKNSLLWFTWFLLIVAATGPKWIGEPIYIERSGRDLMLAIDLSGSMEIEDLRLNGKQVDRLTVVKKVAGDFIERRKNDRLGLILFGTRAYLQTPLTFDHKTVRAMLDDSTIGLPGPQTAIGDAIGLAIKRLSEQSEQNSVLVLLTDGQNNAGSVTPIEAAQLAADYNIRIYTISLSADKMTVQGFFGPQVVNTAADLDEETMRKVSEITGGLHFRARDTQELETIYATLDQLEPIAKDAQIFRPENPLYHWPLSAALLLTVALALPRVKRKGLTI